MPWILAKWLVPPVEEVDLMARWYFSERVDFFLHPALARHAHRCGFAFKGDHVAFSCAVILSGSCSYRTPHSVSNDLDERTCRWFSGTWKLRIASFTALGISLAEAGEAGGFNHPLLLWLSLVSPELFPSISFGQALVEEEPPTEELDKSTG